MACRMMGLMLGSALSICLGIIEVAPIASMVTSGLASPQVAMIHLSNVSPYLNLNELNGKDAIGLVGAYIIGLFLVYTTVIYSKLPSSRVLMCSFGMIASGSLCLYFASFSSEQQVLHLIGTMDVVSGSIGLLGWLFGSSKLSNLGMVGNVIGASSGIALVFKPLLLIRTINVGTSMIGFQVLSEDSEAIDSKLLFFTLLFVMVCVHGVHKILGSILMDASIIRCNAMTGLLMSPMLAVAAYKNGVVVYKNKPDRQFLLALSAIYFIYGMLVFLFVSKPEQKEKTD